MPRLAALAIALPVALFVAFGAARDARAQDKAGGGADTPLPPGDKKPPLTRPDLWVDMMMQRNWKDAPARPFVAITLDLGWVYLRPRLSLGYGKPFTSWVGIDANPIISANALGVYGGLRLNLPRLSFRAGARYTASLYRTYLDRQDSYDRIDFDTSTNGRARVVTYEAELEGTLPLGPGDVLGLVSLSALSNLQDGKNAFEETLRVIGGAGPVWRARGGYALRFGTLNQHSIGMVVDAFDVSERDPGFTLRAGPVVRIVLSRRVEVRGSFVATIISPDQLGLAGSDFTELGLRYRWATE